MAMDSPSRSGVIDEATGQPIKSRPGVTAASILFLNKSGYTVTIYWIDYSGSLVKFASLDHGKLFRIKTFVEHPWIACSERDGRRMQFYYQPRSDDTSKGKPKFSNILWPTSSPNRASVAFILSPVYTLKEVCFRHLQIMGVSYDSASKLRLPKSIFEDLVEFANLKVPQVTKSSGSNEKQPSSQPQESQGLPLQEQH